ncbi:MAG TPA: rhomboid family intramembrane serine protease [candidate division Zixibacteria bacterium]|nr:rhomboid family intramembrane serine protease [candidate division Zixibacteria bacterium]
MRGYYRQRGFHGGGAGSAVLGLIIANAAFFLLQGFVPGFTNALALTPHLVREELKIYQLVSYMFLHGSFIHIFFNLFVLYMFGRELESIWGTGKFLAYYFFSGVGAGVITALMTDYPVVGASGAIYGLLLAYGLTFPNRRLLLWFIIPLKAKYAVILFGAIEFFLSMTGAQDGIAHLTHLGGMIFGGLLMAIWRMKGAQTQKRKDSYLDELGGGAISPGNVDRILDKVLREGPESLTDDERDILIRAGKFYRQKDR